MNSEQPKLHSDALESTPTAQQPSETEASGTCQDIPVHRGLPAPKRISRRVETLRTREHPDSPVPIRRSVGRRRRSDPDPAMVREETTDATSEPATTQNYLQPSEARVRHRGDEPPLHCSATPSPPRRREQARCRHTAHRPKSMGTAILSRGRPPAPAPKRRSMKNTLPGTPKSAWKQEIRVWLRAATQPRPAVFASEGAGREPVSFPYRSRGGLGLPSWSVADHDCSRLATPDGAPAAKTAGPPSNSVATKAATRRPSSMMTR